MGYTAVRSHTRRGYQVRAHARRTSGRHIADILQRDLDRVFERIDQQGATEQLSSANPDCRHPGWYPVRHVDGKNHPGLRLSTSSDYVRVMDQRLCQWLLCQANSYPVR